MQTQKTTAGNGAQAPKPSDRDVIHAIWTPVDGAERLVDAFPVASNVVTIGHNTLANAPRLYGSIAVTVDGVSRPDLAGFLMTSLARATLNNKECTSISEVWTAEGYEPSDTSHLEDVADTIVQALRKNRGLSVGDRAKRRDEVQHVLNGTGDYSGMIAKLIPAAIKYGTAALREAKEPRKSVAKVAVATADVASALDAI